MNVKRIVKAYLIEGGYDGLCNPEIDCGCLVDDLMPCGEQCERCQPAYKVPADPKTNESDYSMSVEKGDNHENIEPKNL